MQKEIYPCLWFDGNAKEAADYYCTVFNNTQITDENPMVVMWEMNGQKFMGLNGGSTFKPNASISFFVVCETMEEIEEAWNKLTDGGSIFMPLDKYEWSEKYGWVQDKFGISWQLAFGKLKEVGQKYTPTLMFTQDKAGKAEEAIHFYTSVFDNSSIEGILKYEKGDHDTEGNVKHAQFKLYDNVFMAMDSSLEHAFKFDDGISLVVNCDNQKEIDYFWNKLTEGGEESQCGWLKDKYGVSWQIVPSVLGKLMSDPDRSQRVAQVFMKMKKFDIAELENA
jgi:predicted 3-demethylubiquinone-9 3-methyltransferase (glyoxalase superfamily)